MVPRLAQKTTPRPMASGPPQVRNLSLGAQAATVDSPPTMPAVYQAARVRIGPPDNKNIIKQMKMRLFTEKLLSRYAVNRKRSCFSAVE